MFLQRSLSQINVKGIEATYQDESKNNSESTCKTTFMLLLTATLAAGAEVETGNSVSS